MKFQTMSLLAGNHICNAACPFCVSRMTDANGIDKASTINRINLKKAIQLAHLGGVTSVIITGKGEPTLYPNHVLEYLIELNSSNGFPFIELQTNGWLINEDTIPSKFSFIGDTAVDVLKRWGNLGLTTIMISNVGYDMELNRKTYFPKRKEYIDIQRVVDRCHEAGLIVRYTTVGINGGIDNPESFDELIKFCDKTGIEQLTWRPVSKTTDSVTNDITVNEWVQENGITVEQHTALKQHVIKNGTKLYDLVHGATVYDYKGQNVCMSTCLTSDPDIETIRQLIFHPDGKLFTDWQYKGSRLL